MSTPDELWDAALRGAIDGAQGDEQEQEQAQTAARPAPMSGGFDQGARLGGTPVRRVGMDELLRDAHMSQRQGRYGL